MVFNAKVTQVVTQAITQVTHCFLMAATVLPRPGAFPCRAAATSPGPAPGWLNLALAHTLVRRRVKSEASAKNDRRDGRSMPARWGKEMAGEEANRARTG